MSDSPFEKRFTTPSEMKLDAVHHGMKNIPLREPVRLSANKEYRLEFTFHEDGTASASAAEVEPLPAREVDMMTYDERAEMLKANAGKWQPIETVPEGEHVLLYWQNGERGNGGMETAIVYRERPLDQPYAFGYWTHGGPNSGSDWESEENPTHWMPLPDPPIG